jgi:hypothetical protein
MLELHPVPIPGRVREGEGGRRGGEKREKGAGRREEGRRE